MAAAYTTTPAGIVFLPLDQLVPDPNQPRRDWRHDHGAERLDDLTASIREFGILQPLLAREIAPLPDGTPQYMLIAGARRRVAAQRAGLETVPVILRDEASDRLRILQLIENLQRQDLLPLDEARAYQELIDLGGQTPAAVAAAVHVSAQQVRDRLRLLANHRLSDAVARRQIASSVAREIIKLDEPTAAPLYARLEDGESLQMSDITRARTMALAAGQEHPRHKGGRPRHTITPRPESHPYVEVSLTQAHPQTLFTPDCSVGKEHDSVRSSLPWPATPTQLSAPSELANDTPQAYQEPPAPYEPAPSVQQRQWNGEPSVTTASFPPPDQQPIAGAIVEPPPISIASGVHARIVALLQRPEAAVLRDELRALLRLPDATTAVMAAITAGVVEPPGQKQSGIRHRM